MYRYSTIGNARSIAPRSRSRRSSSTAPAIAAAIAALPAKDPKLAGRIIGQIKKQFGDKADGTVVKRLVDEAFAG
jgi:uncharacterized protein YqeY